MAEDGDNKISADEVALYDRQIRLWGMEAQSRMRNAHILLIGLRGVANETAKNLVLAGIGALTVVDTENVTEADLAAQFFVQEKDIGKNRAEAALPEIQALNPRVKLQASNVDVKSQSEEWFSQFQVVIATDQTKETLLHLDLKCRKAGRPFYAAGSFGLYGYVFADLIKHAFLIERDKSNINTQIAPETKTRRVVEVAVKREGGQVKEYITKEETYAPLAEVLQAPLDRSWRIKRKRTVPQVLPCLYASWEHQRLTGHLPTYDELRLLVPLINNFADKLELPSGHVQSSFISSWIQNQGSELAPVCAILGGVLAQDVINVLGKREQPIQNFLVFDGDSNAAPILCLQPVEDQEEGTDLTAKTPNPPASVDVVEL